MVAAALGGLWERRMGRPGACPAFPLLGLPRKTVFKYKSARHTAQGDISFVTVHETASEKESFKSSTVPL